MPPRQGSATLTFEVDSKEVTAMLQRGEMAIGGYSLGMFMKIRVEPYLQGRARDRFRKEGDDVTGRWAPLQESTQNIRESQGFGREHPINRRTGELEDYITNTAGQVVTTSSSATLTLPGSAPTGELADKVATAQQGRNNPNTTKREVLGMNVVDLEAVLVQMGDYLVDVMSGGALATPGVRAI